MYGSVQLHKYIAVVACVHSEEVHVRRLSAFSYMCACMRVYSLLPLKCTVDFLMRGTTICSHTCAVFSVYSYQGVRKPDTKENTEHSRLSNATSYTHT